MHVFGDGQANINLRGIGGTAELVWFEGMNRGEARRAMQVVGEQQDFLLARWEDIHGRID
nr:hypothetical protein [uncultured Rhodopila sp.]